MKNRFNRVYVLFLALIMITGLTFVTACDSEAEETTSAETPSEEMAVEPETSVEVDLESALKERVLGDPSAPIQITEFASFTCSHCAEFSNGTLPEFKKNYIDTGKAALISKEFIRNKVDMHAASTARCVSQMRYFDFIEMLFARQEEWAYSANYLDFLKERAAEYGVSAEMFNACVNNEALHTGVLEVMRESQTKYGIDSTPTFIVNGDEKISGALPYDAFEKAVQDIVSGKGTDENQ